MFSNILLKMFQTAILLILLRPSDGKGGNLLIGGEQRGACGCCNDDGTTPKPDGTRITQFFKKITFSA